MLVELLTVIARINYFYYVRRLVLSRLYIQWESKASVHLENTKFIRKLLRAYIDNIENWLKYIKQEYKLKIKINSILYKYLIFVRCIFETQRREKREERKRNDEYVDDSRILRVELTVSRRFWCDWLLVAVPTPSVLFLRKKERSSE